MRRQKKFKKIRLPVFLDDLKERIFKKVINVAVISLFFIIALVLVKAFLYRSDYFRLRVIETKDISTKLKPYASHANSELLKLYKNKNIFEIDIKGIAKSSEASYPDAKDIIVRRALPDKLIIDLNMRKPIALLSDTRYYPVDEEGFMLTNADAGSLKGLPIIAGIDIRNGARFGRNAPVGSKNLKTALDLLREMKKSRFLAEYKVNTIEAGDINNMTFYLQDNLLEIRIGHENFKERLGILRKMLKNPRFALDKIKYIDLRFKDVVVAPR